MANEFATALYGRGDECEALDQLTSSIRGGRSQVLVLRGDAGVGKTALLTYLLESASGCRSARVVGDESEMELAFAGLHQLCAPLMSHLDRLPRPQRDALATAFGLSAGDPPDRFLVGLAVLSLLSDIGEDSPLVCLVDDAQWLDRASAQTLAFVARRLCAESVAIVFATRASGDQDLDGLPEMHVQGLDDQDARALLEAALHAPLDAAVRETIIAETRGNPLALLELPRALTPTELAGGFGLGDTMPLATLIEAGFVRRLESLTDETRSLLLVAAVEPVGDTTLLWRAAERLGIGVEAAAEGEMAGLIEIDARVRFHHPLVRSAVCRTASAHELREAHRVLAEVTDPKLDPDRRAWHRARATVGHDDDVATELEMSAARAHARGGLAAGAAFLQRSAELTPDPQRRADRALAAAQAKHQAGAPNEALALLAAADAGPPDAFRQARASLLRGQVAFASGHSFSAPALLLEAAKQLEPLDIDLARETYLDAFTAALFVGRRAGGVGLLDVAIAARATPPPLKHDRPSDLLLSGLALTITEGYNEGAPVLKRALEVFRKGDISSKDELRWLWLAGRVAMALWDDETWNILASRHVQLARDEGALTVLVLALRTRILVHLYAGELDEAASLVEEAEAVAEVIGSGFPRYSALGLASWRGRDTEAERIIEDALKDIGARGEGTGLILSLNAWTALLYNGLGRYPDALAAADRACECEDLGVRAWALTELVEAAVRQSKVERASEALEQLAQTTRSSGSEWALGTEARCRAMVSEGEAADSLYREAIDHLERTQVRVELARARLVYGEWLRRENRRLEAREQLRIAHDLFLAMGVDGFADRTRRELMATGETVRKRTDETRDQLTPQETQIARLASDGRTNPEIGAQLFLSPRTIEWHLSKVYPKLGIRSRKELRGALPEARLTASSL